MKRRNFLKLVGISMAVVAVPVIPTFKTSIFDNPEVMAVLNRFPDELLPNEKLAIARFVTASMKDGTWAIMDSFSWHAMNTERNALTNWKGNG